jgi:hypothetical protein
MLNLQGGSDISGEFQSVTDALKIIFFINYFAEIQLSCLPKCKKRHIQANMYQ